MRKLLLRFLAAVALAGPACAHQASDAFVQMHVRDDGIDVRWDVALRDLDAVMPLDADDDGRLTWGEVRRALPSLQDRVLGDLQVPGCPLALRDTALEARADGVYLAWHLRGDCRPPAALPIAYRFLADVDATHRAIASLRFADGRTEARVLDPQAQDGAARGVPPHGGFVVEGMRHLAGGLDHVLFLACLLLPAVLRREGGRWSPLGRARDALGPTLKIVTLFTLAHSTTMVLATLGHVRLAPSIVEPAIAATIAAAALDNLVPLFGRFRAAVTFAFGLVHGFGFAGVLGELELPSRDFGWALLQFNVGLELAQAALVALLVPVLMALGRRPAYPRWVLGGGSMAAMAMALVWVAERLASGGAT